MRVRLVSTLVLALAASGCGGAPAAPSAPAAVVDAVTGVTNMVPAPNTTLAAGQTVTLSGTPAYALYSADLGMVQMAIEDQNDRPLPTSSIQAILVHRGTGDATISQTVALPPDGVTSVHVYFLLVPAGAAPTQASVRLTYPVR
jgi:hypothetical protein